MSAEENKENKPTEQKPTQSPPATTSDKETKEKVQRTVHEHIIKLENPSATPPTNPPANTPNTSPAPSTAVGGEEIGKLKKQLDDAEKARLEAENSLTDMQSKLGITEDKLQQQEGIIQNLAIKEFEEKKNLLVETVRKSLGDEKADEVGESIQTGEDVDRIQRMLDIFGDVLEGKKGEGANTGTSAGAQIPAPSKKPAGKVPMSHQQSGKPAIEGQTYNSVEEMVNDVYDKYEEQLFLKSVGQPYDEKALQKGRMQTTRLLQSLIQGEKTRGKVTRLEVQQCRSCGKILTQGETKCPVCSSPLYYKTGGGN